MGRQVIDIRKDGEKVYVKNHAKVTFLSDGTNVEQRIIDVSNDLSTKVSKDYIDDILENIIIDSSQIDFNQLQNNPFVDNNSGKLEVMDEAGNIIAKIDANGIHSVDFIAGNHKLTDKIDSSALNGYAKESWVTAEITKAATEGKVDLTGYATEEWVEGKNYLTEHQDISHLATKQELSDLDFYSIKDNPIINEGNGQLIFADESGYIGLQLEEDGLHVKDVIADGHILSEKANASDLSNYATKDEVSSLVDMSVVEELQGKVETLVGEDVDKSVREIANDELAKQLLEGNDNFQTLQELSAWIDEHPDSAATMNESIQKNAEDITKSLTSAKSYTDEKVSNIDFYNIKDNPMVDGEAGTITFVDETGYIGLKVTEDGIIAKDVVTPEHILSEKADKSFVEDNYYNKSTVDKKITEAVTGGQVSLDGFATEQWVNEQGFLKTHQDISHLAEKSELPKKISDLENDSKFITIDEVPEVTVPTKVSDLTNDSGFITLADVPVQEIPDEYVTETELNSKGYLTEHQDISHLATKAELPTVPTKVSELENDKGFLTEHQDISHLASRNWVESQGYAHQEDLLEISFNDIQDSPISIDDSGMINFVDESGNVGFQINEEGLRVSEVIVGEHKLSEKANVSDIPSLDGYAKTEDLPDFSEFAKLENIPEVPSLDGYATEEWVENKNYATEYDLKTIDFSSINNVPLNEDASGEFSIVDESGNVGMKVSSDAVYAKDFISGEHKLSEKASKSDIPTKLSQLENDINITDKTISDGVYAVTANEELIDYNEADESCIGVALVAGEHKFMIAKSDATNDGSNYNLYYDYDKGDLSLTNYSNADGTNSYGYLGGSSTPQLSQDFTTWTEGALSDFNGKSNTQVIAASSSNAKDMCKVLETFNAGSDNQGHTDWYVPACGQLALMYLAKTDINAALAKIGGTAFNESYSFYWSSSEYDANYAWYVNFGGGYVDAYDKSSNYRVRFIRDISVPKSLKERVSDLESQLGDINTILESIING